LDGQHRLTAISELNEYELDGGYVESLVTFDADKECFHAIDQNRTRSNKDALFIAGFTYSHQLPAVVRLLEQYETGKFEKRLTNAKMIELANKYEDICESVSFGGSFVKTKLLSLSVAGACHYLFRQVSPEKTEEFFDSLRNGIGLKKGNPVLVLRDYCLRTKIRTHMGYQWLWMVIDIWNRCREGKSLYRLLPDAVIKRRARVI